MHGIRSTDKEAGALIVWTGYTAAAGKLSVVWTRWVYGLEILVD